MNRSSCRVTALVLGDVTVLLALRPRWSFVAAGLTRPGSWLDTSGPDVAVAALCGVLLWLAAAWIAIGLVVGLGTRLPGATGRVCARFAQVVVPKVLLRVVIGSAGLGLLAAPAAPAAQAAAVGPAVGMSVSQSTSNVPSPTWPVTPSASTPVAAPTRLPAPVSPTTTTPTTTRPTTPPSTPPSTRTRVHRGDSLWLLAARRLGPHSDASDVAHYWPEIYAANRGVIGDNPSVIHSGQVLDLPAPTQESR